MWFLILSLLSLVVVSEAVVVLDFSGYTTVGRTRKQEKRATIPSAVLQNDNVQYLVNLTLGTPPQNLQFRVATNAGDLLLVSQQDPLCAVPSNNCTGGLFDQNASSSYKVVDTNFTTTYTTGNNATGVYATDVVRFGEVQIDNLQFGLQLAGSNKVNILGVGYAQLEEANTSYPNLPYRMFNQGLANIIGYSMYFNDYNTLDGRIAFGGIDTGKFYGQFQNLQIAFAATSLKYYYTTISLDSVALQSNNGRKPLPGSSLSVVPDSSGAFLTLPMSIVQQIQQFTQFVNDTRTNFLVKEYSRIDNTTLLNVTFGTTTISIPMSSLSARYNSTHRTLLVRAATRLPYVLGLPFFRAAYTVFDFTHNQFSVAPLNLESPTTNITAIPAAGVAGIQGVLLAPPDSTSNTGNNGSTGGGNDNGQNSNKDSGLSTGAKIGIGVGVGMVLLLIIGAVTAAMLIRRRRRRKRAQATAAANTEKPAVASDAGLASYQRSGQQHDVPYGQKAELAPTEYSNGGYPPDGKRVSGMSSPGYDTSELGESTIAPSSSYSAAHLEPVPGVHRIGRKPVAAPVEMPASVPAGEAVLPRQGHGGSQGSSDNGRSPVSPPLETSRVASGYSSTQ